MGEDEGEGTAGLLAGQRRLAEAAAAARPQVPRPGAAPPPAVSAAAGHVRPPLRPLPAPASSAGRHPPDAGHMPQVPCPFPVLCAAHSKACGDPGLALHLGVGGNLPLPAYPHQPGPQAGPPGVASLPFARVKPLRPVGMERTTVSSPRLLISFLNPHLPSHCLVEEKLVHRRRSGVLHLFRASSMKWSPQRSLRSLGKAPTV